MSPLSRWAAGLSVVALMIYAAWDRAGVVYDADDIAVVDFSDLPSSSRRGALQAANQSPMQLRVWDDARAVRGDRLDLSRSRDQHRADPDAGAWEARSTS